MTFNKNNKLAKFISFSTIIILSAIFAALPVTIARAGEIIKSEKYIVLVSKNKTKNILNKTKNLTANHPVHIYDNLIQGFSIKMTSKEAIKVNTFNHVTGVYPVKTYRESLADLANQKVMTNIAAHDSDQFKGDGTVIAVLDTGLTPDQTLLLNEPSTKETKLTTKISGDFIDKNNRGQYINAKVPFAYDYANKSNNVVVESNEALHGSTISNIIGSSKYGITPNAQLLEMKVFKDDENYTGAQTDDIIAALEDASKLHADVINMSFSDISGGLKKDVPEQKVIKKLQEKGITIVAAAGNNSISSSVNFFDIPKPYFLSEDIETVGAPSIYEPVISVGATNVGSVGNNNATTPLSMDNVSSWGPSANLDFKPDIAAPGGAVQIPIGDGSQTAFGEGTSTASAVVAAYAAKYYQKYGYPSNKNMPRFIKQTMANSATVINDTSGTPLSPRWQGAGAVNIDKALSQDATLINDETQQPNVSLYSMTRNYKLIRLKLTNYSDKVQVYQFNKPIFYTSEVDSSGALHEVPTDAVRITASDDTVNVPANQSRTVLLKATIDGGISKDKFIEGYLKFSNILNSNGDLSLPIMGFNGNFDSQKIIDDPAFASSSKTKVGYLISNTGDPLGLTKDNTIDLNHVAISTNDSSNQKSAYPLFFLLRNASKLDFQILSSDDHIVKNIGQRKIASKDTFSYTLRNFTVNDQKNMVWNGMNQQNQPMTDGKYTYAISAWSDVDFPEKQVWQFPLILDSTNPAVDDWYQKENDIFLKCSDNLSGINQDTVTLTFNGSTNRLKPISIDNGYFHFKIPDNETIDLNNSNFVFSDLADNTTTCRLMQK